LFFKGAPPLTIFLLALSCCLSGKMAGFV